MMRTARGWTLPLGLCLGVALIGLAGLSAWQSGRAARVAGAQARATTGSDAGQEVPAPLTEPFDLMPAEILLGWQGRPLPGEGIGSAEGDSAPAIVDLLKRLAGSSLDSGAQLTLRLFEGFGLVAKYPFALALLDATAKPIRPGSDAKQVDQLKIVLVVKMQGQPEPLFRQIQKIINEQTDKGVAKLALKQSGDWKYQELIDSRLPAWCVVAWGTIEDYFVVTLGDGVWQQVAKTARGEATAVSGDAWAKAARREARPEPLIEILLDAKALRNRLDPFVDGRATDFFAAWDAQDLDRGHWALGFKDEALYCLAHFKSGEATTTSLYADPSIHDEKLLATVPAESRYAIYTLPLKRMVPQFVNSINATRGPALRAKIEQRWREACARYGFKPEDVLDHLGEHLVLHNNPPHPLRLPLAVTTLTEIRDNPKEVRASLEKMCEAWQDLLESSLDNTAPSSNPTRIFRDDDGIWYIQFGFLAGPAWTVTDRYIITSWSPKALRMYLRTVGDKAGKR